MTVKDFRNYLLKYCDNIRCLDFVCVCNADDQPQSLEEAEELYNKAIGYADSQMEDGDFYRQECADKQVKSFEIWSDGIVIYV